jgi:hypothetical protein
MPCAVINKIPVHDEARGIVAAVRANTSPRVSSSRPSR